MAKKPNNASQPVSLPAQLSTDEIARAIPKLERRIAELSGLNLDALNEETGDNELAAQEDKINATLREIYGHDTIEFNQYHVSGLRSYTMMFFPGQDTSYRARLPDIKIAVSRAIAQLKSARDILQERLEDDSPTSSATILRAYQGLNLHPEIARRASQLYIDGHYANAVEAAVKALNGLVRLRSDLETDGSKLMEQAFSPTNPVLKFNDLSGQSEKDEQKGFMMLFSGAVSGLRNPRAHEFTKDDPERALEFIAFVSLLAKLLDDVRQ